MNLRRIDVLLDETTGKRYDKGDLVVITIDGYYEPKEYVGKIKHIDTLNITLDTSLLYESEIKKINFEDIRYIQKIIQW